MDVHSVDFDASHASNLNRRREKVKSARAPPQAAIANFPCLGSVEREGCLGTEAGRDRRGVARILIVDDHPVVRQGLIVGLGRDPGLMICGEAGGLEEAMAAIRSTAPDLVLADLELDGLNGLDLLKSIRASHPDIPTLMLSMHDEGVYAERALRAGARGYLMKTVSPEELLAGIHKILEGGLAISDRIKAKMAGALSGGNAEGNGLRLERLSDRELEVFRLIGRGHTTRNISGMLSLSVKTVEAHCANIKQKLGFANAAELQFNAFHSYRGNSGAANSRAAD